MGRHRDSFNCPFSIYVDPFVVAKLMPSWSFDHGVVFHLTEEYPEGSWEYLLQKLERDAYLAVLRAFGAQSEAITWVRGHA